MKLIFNSLDEMSKYFISNPAKKDVIAIVKENGKHRYYRCFRSQCIDITNEYRR